MRVIRFRQWYDGKMRLLDNAMYGPGQIGFSDTFWTDLSDMDNENMEVMQYTGLKDKNGVEIYEGDVLWGGEVDYDEAHPQGFNIAVGIVGFKDGAFRLEYADGSVSDDDNATNPDWWDQYEVIGNIYENPELVRA